VVDHRVHVAGANSEEKPGPSKLAPCLAIVPVGLADDTDTVSCRFQHSAENGHGEAGMIDVSVARDDHDVDLFPSACQRLGPRHR
jgi:hypothetical protein